MLFDDPGAIGEVGERVLMLAPTPRDAAMARSILAESGFMSEVFESYEDLARALQEGAGVIILMEEFLASKDAASLLEVLGRQPAWSSLALIVLSAGRDRFSMAQPALKSFANAVLVERPVRIAPLVSAIGAALAARRRQYEIRDYIQEIKRSAQERDRLYQAAEAANRMKDDFLATLSHELRTPLNAILGWARILRSGKVDEGDREQGLAAIERNSTVQAQIIEDLLDISRIVAGNFKIEVQRVNIREIIEAAIGAVMPAATAKEIRLHKILDSLAGPVSGDPARLQQVVWNLLSNAVKFTPKGGQVQVLLERVNSHVEISIIDTGMGIRPEFLPNVFDRFRQADSSTTRRHGGLGLGLAIVKQLVEMHGGTVRAKSPGEGQGATFVVTLPITVVHPDEPATAKVRPKEQETKDDLCESGALAGVKVLVVDDEPDARQLIRRVLTECEAEVVLASSAEEALALIDRFRPHVIISDVGMPGQDGYDFIRQVRAKRSSKELPAAALTAFARSEDRRQALRAGFQTHVAKPVDPAELIAVVASLAGRTSTA